MIDEETLELMKRVFGTGVVIPMKEYQAYQRKIDPSTGREDKVIVSMNPKRDGYRYIVKGKVIR